MTKKKLTSRKQLLIVFIVIIYYTIDIQMQAQKDTARYVFSEFAIGSVKMKNGQTEFALMNYNELTEEMIFKKDGVLLYSFYAYSGTMTAGVNVGTIRY